MPKGSSSRNPASVTFWVASRSGIMRAPSATKAGSAGAEARMRRRPRRQHALFGEFELRPDRMIRFIRRLWRGRRNPCAQRHAFRNSGLDFALEDRGKRRTLRDQFGLGLLDQLVLVEFQEIQAEQRQQQHADEHQKHDETEAWPPLLPRGHRSGGVGQRDASQRPSLKPTPWTVSITESHPAAAILARMFRMWLSMVRSATWMLPA